MAKKSQRRLRYEKGHIGCMWGFISIFDFRRGVSTKKLLADRRRPGRQVGASSSSKLMIPDHGENSMRVEDDEEREVASRDKAKTRAKELMGKDAPAPKTQSVDGDTELEPQPFGTSHRTKSHKKTHETSKRSKNLSLSDLDDYVTREAISGLSSRYKVCSSDDLNCSKEEQLSYAMKVFINHKLKNSNKFLREEGEISDDSKELTDALETLRANTELFHRLLQDPNSNLVKHIESLNDGLEKVADEIIERNQQPPKFTPRRRSKSQGSSQPSNKIVILKPGPVRLPVHNKVQSERNMSLFSFTEIRRKLKHVMGKDREGTSPEIKKSVNSEKGVSGENVGWSSPNRNHFYTERFAKKRVPNIYLEAKKHIFEMLESGEEKEGSSMSGNLSKSLGKILSLPSDYYISSRSSSGNSFSSEDQISSSQRRVEADVPSLGQAAVEDSEEQSQSRCHENERVSNASRDLCSCSITVNTDNAYVTVSFFDESSELTSECLKTESKGTEQNLSSPPDSSANSFETCKAGPDCVVDKTERPSPISVLDPLCMEDDISPASTSCRSVEPDIQPRKIQFEEESAAAEAAHSTPNQQALRTCLESEETAFEYVEAVLLGSDLNWDEYLSRWLFSDQILDLSLFDEVELFSNRSCHDQKLLFDCTNEVLKEVIDFHFPIVKLNIRPIPKGMDLIHRVWAGVEWHLLKHSLSRSLDQLIKKQMEKPGAWLDLHSEIGIIGFVIESAVLEELLDEIFYELI
ncbi:hypothetical protein DM860_004625 [Cuscuta australis]|uniref:DUF4378 domain-containing protein n=1 Tax=Cuscuta australis TaxID=267555 RepID=A0A328E826_9ASTE|nr:hypothetical protein DM860_004625 [Cuscuta australis]